jgi:hypothetical protein
MSMRRIITAGLGVGVSLALTVPVAGQKNKPTSRQGDATFRCNEGEPVACGFADKVRGVYLDDYAGTGTPESGQGAHLTAGGEMWIGLRNGLDAVLDFANVDQNGLCVAAGNCRFLGAGLTPTIAIPIGGVSSSGVYAEIEGNVVTSEGDPSPTMVSLSQEGGTSNIRLNISFRDAVMGLLWGFNYNASQYPGALDATVTRTGCTWVISGSKAGLSAYGSDFGRGKSYRTNEGLYLAPFEITFSVPSPCS